MDSTLSTALRRRVEDRIGAWRVVVERVEETESSVLAFGQRGNQSVVLKVIRRHGDEWRSGEVLKAFDGRGVVRVLDHFDGALLLERLMPGTCLASIAMSGSDDRATGILADVIGRMSPGAPADAAPTVQAWGHGFERHAARGGGDIPKPLLEAAQLVYSRLCGSQSRPRLLHGDLHHYNVLLDAERGWVAVDPKGVVGELEYEIGAAFRNPYERSEVFTARATIEQRAWRFGRELQLDTGRILQWAFAQAVLSVIWAAEDGFAVASDHPCIALAENIWPMIAVAADV